MAGKRTITESTSNNNVSLRNRITESARNSYTRTTGFIKRRPLGSFIFVFVLLLAILVLSRLLQQNTEPAETKKLVKNVEVYSIGDGPKATYQARIEKTGVITIVAQSPGIVQNITAREGDKVNKGQQIISLSSNYQGGNAASVQRQIAQRQYQNVLDTFDTQNQLIQKQQVVATASAENAQRTRDITRQSLGETTDLINANQDQLNQLNATLDTLESNGAGGGGTNNEQVGELQGTITQLQGGINQLRAAQRTSEYQASNDNPPATLADAQEEIALKQLDIQRKSLELNKDVAKLQVSLAYVSEAMMYPASPFTGIVENIAVKQGQAVNAGTELATIAADTIETSAQLEVPQTVASLLSVGEPSTAKVRNKTFQIVPFFVSSEATNGQLYSVKYAIPAEYQKEVIDGDYILIEVPLKAADTTTAVPLIPIDAVYQTQDKSYVMVAQQNKAITKDIRVGEVFGNYVAVESGLGRGDQVILNRNVIADDTVKIQ